MNFYSTDVPWTKRVPTAMFKVIKLFVKQTILLTLEFSLISAITGLILIFSQTGTIFRQEPIVLCSSREHEDVAVWRIIWFNVAFPTSPEVNFILFIFGWISITSTVGSITIDVIDGSEKIFQLPTSCPFFSILEYQVVGCEPSW